MNMAPVIEVVTPDEQKVEATRKPHLKWAEAKKRNQVKIKHGKQVNSDMLAVGGSQKKKKIRVQTSENTELMMYP